jgi:hypothetical protein
VLAARARAPGVDLVDVGLTLLPVMLLSFRWSRSPAATRCVCWRW